MSHCTRLACAHFATSDGKMQSVSCLHHPDSVIAHSNSFRERASRVV